MIYRPGYLIRTELKHYKPNGLENMIENSLAYLAAVPESLFLVASKAALSGLFIGSDFFKRILGCRYPWTGWVQYTEWLLDPRQVQHFEDLYLLIV